MMQYNIFLDKKKNIHSLALNYIVILFLGFFFIGTTRWGKGGSYCIKLSTFIKDLLKTRHKGGMWCQVESDI